MNQRAIRRRLPLHRPAIAAVVAAMLPLAASAQQAPAQQPPAGEGPNNATWIKVCSEDPTQQKQLCQIIFQLTAETGQFIASVNVQQMEGEPKMILAAAVRLPTSGVLVGPGMRAQIDDGDQRELGYTICFPEVCYADMEIDEQFVNTMKSGNRLILITLTQANNEAGQREPRPLPIPISLVGFTKAFDGEGIDPQAAQAVRDDLARSLQERADELGQRLRERQQEAPPQ